MSSGNVVCRAAYRFMASLRGARLIGVGPMMSQTATPIASAASIVAQTGVCSSISQFEKAMSPS